MRLATTCLAAALLLGPALPAHAGEGEPAAAAPKKEVRSMSVEHLTRRTGNWWFAVEKGGEAVGFARLEASARDEGGVAYAWETKLAFPGFEHEESQTMVLGRDWKLVSASYAWKGETLVEGRRSGDRVVGTARRGADAEPDRVDREISEDAVTGLGFVLAGCMPQESGAALIRTEVDVRRGFEKLGTTVLRVREPEAVPGAEGDVEAFRIDVVGPDGSIQKFWVDGSGGIVRAEWGDGLVTIARSASTEHLFRPVPPAVSEVRSGPEKLVVRGEFPAVSPEKMFERWTRPEQLARWWPPEAEIGTEVGGAYHLSWPSMHWYLKGTITVYEPGRKLGFTWKWHHQKPDAPVREVLVEMAPREGGGTILTITHGPYGEGEAEASERKGHLAGWRQFCTMLAALDD